MTPEDKARSLLWSAIGNILFFNATPWELDEAMEASGLEIGPCLAMDAEGLDTVAKAVAGGIAHSILSRMVSEGRLGRKTSWGFYRYTRSGGAIADPLVADLINEEVRFAGKTRQDLGEEDLIVRMKTACSAVESEMRGLGYPETDTTDAIVAVLGCANANWWR